MCICQIPTSPKSSLNFNRSKGRMREKKKRADSRMKLFFFTASPFFSSTLLFQTRVRSRVIRGNPELYETPCITAVADTTIVRAVFVVDGERVAGRTGIE